MNVTSKPTVSGGPYTGRDVGVRGGEPGFKMFPLTFLKILSEVSGTPSKKRIHNISRSRRCHSNEE